MKRRLIELLASKREEYLSGEEIAERFDMTRANVWKYIKELRKNGFEIESVTNKGYRLTRVGHDLNEDTLFYTFRGSSFIKNCVFFEKINSTNDFLKYNDMGFQAGTLAVAKRQLKGRGRRTKEFVSDEGGLYFSFLLKNDMEMTKVAFVTSIVAVAVNKALEDMGVLTKIKWPNDIILNDRKLCGILTEMVTDMERNHQIILGIGLNVKNTFPEELKEIATSLLEQGYQLDELLILKTIMKRFEEFYQKLLHDDREEALFVLRDKSYLKGKRVEFQYQNTRMEGLAQDIEENGNLRIVLEDGETIALNSGEVSIVKIESKGS